MIKTSFWDFLGDLVAKNPPCNTGGIGSIPSWETKIPHGALCGQKIK